MVVVAGNKLDLEGRLVLADGVQREAAMARELSKPLLPVGASGFVARALWEEMRADPGRHLPARTPRRPFNILGSPRATDQQIIDSLFVLIDWLRSPSARM